MVESPGADAGRNLVADAKQSDHRDRSGDGEGDPPPTRGGLLDHPGDPFRDPSEIAAMQDQRHAGKWPLHRCLGFASNDLRRCVDLVHYEIADSGSLIAEWAADRKSRIKNRN